MIIVDSALRKRNEENNPVRVGMIGAGFMGRGIALQICNSVPGMELVAIANRTLEGAARAYQEAGIENPKKVNNLDSLVDNIRGGKYSITSDPMLICEAEGIDAIIEVTGTIEYSLPFVLKAMDHKKHVILMNAEMDGTLGPILKVYADKAGVIITNADGDQPGVLRRDPRALGGFHRTPGRERCHQRRGRGRLSARRHDRLRTDRSSGGNFQKGWMPLRAHALCFDLSHE